MAARKWTVEQRLAQSKAIQLWQPWSALTGKKSEAGKLISSQNGYRGGYRPLMRELARALKEQALFISELESTDTPVEDG